ncbi:MAG: hypothetical protein Q8P68_00545 [Candidatus Peregrinibacteria bacterium]|nr:hypothetical protein [Candidatus Peregrinibacteria bacterium]
MAVGSGCSDTSLSLAPEIEPESLYSDTPTLPSPTLNITSSGIRGCISDALGALSANLICPHPLDGIANADFITAQANYDLCAMKVPDVKDAMSGEMLGLLLPYLPSNIDPSDLTEEEIENLIEDAEIPITFVSQNENDTNSEPLRKIRTQILIPGFPGFANGPEFRANPLTYLINEGDTGFTSLRAVTHHNSEAEDLMETEIAVFPNGHSGAVQFDMRNWWTALHMNLDDGINNDEAEGPNEDAIIRSVDFRDPSLDFDDAFSNRNTAQFVQDGIASCIEDAVRRVQDQPGMSVIHVQ